MLTVVIGIVAIVVIAAAVNDGAWGTAGLAAAVVVVLMLMSDGERKDWQAYRNCRDWWAEGGPYGRRDR